MARIVIFANGELPNPRSAAALLQPGDRIVCADGGTHHALALGLRPDVVIGDLDSIREQDRAQLEAARVPVERHPRDKNQTDLELALQYAVAQDAPVVRVVGAFGKRLDQSLGNLAVLAGPRLASMDVRLDDGLEEAFFCRGRSQVEGRPGDIVSLVPWGAAVEGISTTGLKWPLHAETLYPDQTRGISNELFDAKATVTITSGLLLVIHRRQSQADIQSLEAERK